MLRMYIALFVLLATCDFTLVQSQAPSYFEASSTPIGGDALKAGNDQSFSSSPTNSSTGVPAASPVTVPIVDQFARDIVQVILSSIALKDFVHFEECRPFQMIYNVGHQILLRDAISDPSLALLVAEEAKKVGLLSSIQWFNSMANMLAKFLDRNGFLTVDRASTYPQRIGRYVEDYTIRNGVFNTESLFKDVSNGFYNFLDDLGLINPQYLSQLYHLIAQEFSSLPRKNCNI